MDYSMNYPLFYSFSLDILYNKKGCSLCTMTVFSCSSTYARLQKQFPAHNAVGRLLRLTVGLTVMEGGAAVLRIPSRKHPPVLR